MTTTHPDLAAARLAAAVRAAIAHVVAMGVCDKCIEGFGSGDDEEYPCELGECSYCDLCRAVDQLRADDCQTEEPMTDPNDECVRCDRTYEVAYPADVPSHGMCHECASDTLERLWPAVVGGGR